MRKSELIVHTSMASRYLQALCKHFRHKVAVEFDAQKGFVDFPFGQCHLTADAETLAIRCEAPGEEEERRIRFVIDDHLRRFAWRENLEFDWQAAER